MRAFVFSLLCLAIASTAVAQQQANPAEARLREALRDLTIKLQTAQNDLATAQGANSSLTAERDQAAEKATAAEKLLSQERASSEKLIKELRTKGGAQAEQLEKTSTALKELQTRFEEQRVALEKLESEKTAMQVKVGALEGRLTDRETKNFRLYLIANEVLKRYEDHSLGKVLLAKEPFIGQMRTKLENLIQDYRDKVDAALVKP